MFVTHLRDLLPLHCNWVFRPVYNYHPNTLPHMDKVNMCFFFNNLRHIISISTHPENGKLNK